MTRLLLCALVMAGCVAIGYHARKAERSHYYAQDVQRNYKDGQFLFEIDHMYMEWLRHDMAQACAPPTSAEGD